MTWTTFFAVMEDFAPLVEGMLQFDGAQIFEAYSPLGHQARSFSSARDAVEGFQLGVDARGKGIAAHCAIWVPAVMPPPTRQRIALVTGDWRESIEGCGLFWLQAGGLHGQSITESQLGWFTEASARRRCAAEPGFDRVNWMEHRKVAAELARGLRALSAARAERLPVLERAAHLHSTGYRLLHGPGIKQEVRVGAT